MLLLAVGSFRHRAQVNTKLRYFLVTQWTWTTLELLNDHTSPYILEQLLYFVTWSTATKLLKVQELLLFS